MADTDRGSAMAASVSRTARSAGVDPAGRDMLAAAHALAMQPRTQSLRDDHHPAFLHPGRVVLILLRDAGVTDPHLLSVAALLESEDAALRVSIERVAEDVGHAIADDLRAIPVSGDDALAERLVMLPEGSRLVALAERLDHLRHAHVRGDIDWGAAYDEAVAVWLPVAERSDERLATRFRHWRRMYERRIARDISDGAR